MKIKQIETEKTDSGNNKAKHGEFIPKTTKNTIYIMAIAKGNNIVILFLILYKTNNSINSFINYDFLFI